MLLDRICVRCNINFKGGPRAYFCPECRIIRRRETCNKYRARKRKGLTRKIGGIDKCERCGNNYTVEAGLQRFCIDCKLVHKLEYDRTTGLKYYHISKDISNPIRNLRRQIGPIKCYWCGKEFISHVGSFTCSTECSKKRKNHLWNLWSSNSFKLKKY